MKIATAPGMERQEILGRMRHREATGAEVGVGRAFPLGADVSPDGVNFSVFSRDAHTIELLLFDRVDDPKPSRIISLDPRKNRTYHYWHLFVPNLKPGQIYGYRAIGPLKAKKGFRFDPEKVLLDPYARAVAVPENYSRLVGMQPGDNTATAMKSVVVDVGM